MRQDSSRQRLHGDADSRLNDKPVATPHKALALNLNSTEHGGFTEIGAGQEVACWFFKVGGASGAVAKAISAYGMGVSGAVHERLGGD